ncbi:hypothetical protein RW020113_013 [Synechococcus phage S-RIM2]|uniref:Mannosyl-glycoprotein endo-beta-N-acetylglucosamidase-like domain-containing protein n=1 Tax=Synechococcus phage S-RIM2 TaxID=687800 RepID=A0A1D7S020_9CAUD|nr:hypothetical protein Np030709_013 [Synechococcus phage S-RIM2]AOO02029.1 hypothetical protein Np151112_013 [Synechococcus phage S-RIM2]AOO03526.1 hypothetical protein Np361112_013 [Synechococcus phage S-RIM2]AOO03954.1 hypothetical protein RW020113_013 [Synechococcus phage S-RIM2]AOO06093.1 hypothetical protein RW260905_013 [Synechococcus phage S-RIM2]
MATVQKSTKINFYKFVATKDVSPSAKGADEGTVATVKVLNKNTEALNNIGSVLNGIAKIAQDLKKVMLMQLDAQQRKNVGTFDAQYTKTKKEKKSGFVAGIVGKSVSFLEGLLTTFSNLFKLLVVIPALKWLSDPKNQETIATALRIIRSVVTFIFDWAKFGITNTIDGLYNLLRDDASWWDRIVGLGQAIAGIGAVVLGIRYLSNPLKLVKDITNGVRALVRFVLGGGRGGGGGGKKPRGRFGGAMRLLGGAAIVGGSAYAISQMNQPEEKSQGGSVKILPSRSQGGWISGPQSGYKVSLDGGRSTSFIGHGTEYVARKANGGAFVVPFNTPGTKTQPHLTQKRLGEAKRLGYFANGGEITGNNEQKWSKVMGLGKAAGAKYPELVAAQFALESAWGTALSAKNNFFGIKATGNESATVSNTREVINGRSVYVDARFKNFSTPFDAINHLVTQWYKDYRGYTGVNNAPDAFAAASKLQKEGYATDPQYTKHLSRLMQQYSNLRGAQVTAPTQQPSGNPFMNFFGNLANSVLGIGGANAAEHGGNDNQGRAPEYTGGTADVVGISHPDTGAGYGIKDQKDQHGRPLAFSQPAAEQFSKALKASGMNLGAYIASTGRSDAKNNSVGGHPNSHHMYGEAIDMNGDGYEWMRKNGRKYGWQYVYNHGPGSAHFKYVGPGAGSTPKLGPPGSKPKVGPSVTGGSSSSTSTHSSGTREETKKKVTLADIMGGRSTRPVPLENYKTGNINSHGDDRSIIDATEERNRARQRANEKSSQMVQAAIEAVRLSNTSNEQIIMQAQQGIQQAMQMGSGNSQPQVIPTGGGRGAVKSVVSSLASSINPLRGIFK